MAESQQQRRSSGSVEVQIDRTAADRGALRNASSLRSSLLPALAMLALSPEDLLAITTLRRRRRRVASGCRGQAPTLPL